MSSQRAERWARCAMLFAGSWLVVSIAGCQREGGDSPAGEMAMAPVGAQPSAPGAPAPAGPAGSSSQGSAAAGSTPAMAGGAAGSSPMTSSSTDVMPGGGSSAGSDASTGDGAAGSSSAGTAGTTSESSDAGVPPETADAAVPPPHEDLGKGDGRDVVLIGDSYMSNTLQLEGTGGGIAPSLQRASGQPYRNYAIQGVMLLQADAFGPAIPTQWDQAKRSNPNIKTVVMTGGGNDVIQNPGLQSDCEMDGEQCKQFRMNLIAALDKLWTQMATDGVQDIIYVRYASQPGMMMTGSSATPMIPAICTSGQVRCHSLDTTDLVNGEIAVDGIHPLVSANDRMAKAIVAMMEAEGMRR